ncbi:hypothetical protein ACIRS1_17080 [Kitasatospora sp. NPDC101176]|uniref:hypothetical protein n=1 Tax=Kitasatospora sp. NPDC101176 TaxID=3364099 RepID=UPI003819E862
MADTPRDQPSDIALHHANIDEAADALQQASDGMHAAMKDCMTAIRTAQAQLSGDLATAADTFYNSLSDRDSDMVNEIKDGVGTLRLMHGLLRDADRRAGQGVG